MIPRPARTSAMLRIDDESHHSPQSVRSLRRRQFPEFASPRRSAANSCFFRRHSGWPGRSPTSSCDVWVVAACFRGRGRDRRECLATLYDVTRTTGRARAASSSGSHCVRRAPGEVRGEAGRAHPADSARWMTCPATAAPAHPRAIEPSCAPVPAAGAATGALVAGD